MRLVTLWTSTWPTVPKAILCNAAAGFVPLTSTVYPQPHGFTLNDAYNAFSFIINVFKPIYRVKHNKKSDCCI